MSQSETPKLSYVTPTVTSAGTVGPEAADPHPWSPKDGHDLEYAIEHDDPGMVAIGIGMLVIAVGGLVAGLICGATALWNFALHLLT